MSDTIQYKPMTGLNETSFNKIIEMSGKDLAEKSYVDAAVSNVTVDTTNLATKTELATKADKSYVDNAISNVTVDTTNLATKSELAAKVDKSYVDNAISNVTVDTTNLATKSELAAKVDKVSGKGLSTEDFTTEYKNKLEGLSNVGVSDEQISTAVNKYMQEHPVSGGALTAEQEAKLNEVDNKVDKVLGKGLSTEDFTTEYKNKLEGLSNTGVTDEQISTAVNNYMQEHPVQSGATAEQAAQIQANTTAIGNSNSGLIKEVNDIKNIELQNLNTSIQSLETLVGVDGTGLPSGDANIIASINRIDKKTTTGNGLTSEQVQQLQTAYEHSQSNHVTMDKVNAAISNAQLGSGEIDTTSFATDLSLTGSNLQLKNSQGNLIGNAITLPSTSGGTSETVTVVRDIYANNDMPTVFITSDTLTKLKNKADGKANCEFEIRFKNQIIKCFGTGAVQGTSSANYPAKNYTFKFYSDKENTTKFNIDVGWGSQNKYCFKKNWVDSTHTRNLSGARIAYDMVNSRPESDFKTNLLNTPHNGSVDGFPTKVYVNGEFWGLYTWNIPKDAWMFNMDNSNPNHMVLCAEYNNNGDNTQNNTCEFRSTWGGELDTNWSIEVGTYSETLKNSFNNAISHVINSSDEVFKTNFSNYFDLYSILDYYCFSYLTAHIDGLGKNMLMATYDGVHWGACLYDMDSIYGANWNGQGFKNTNIKCPEEYQETNSLLWQRVVKSFPQELYDRYFELRNGALSLGNIITHVEEIYDLIPDRVFNDDYQKWSGIPGRTENTITRFRNYMRDRAVYCDECFKELILDKSVTAVTITGKTEVKIGNSITLTANLTPSVADVKTGSWSASNTNVTLNESNSLSVVVNGSVLGSSTITFTSDDTTNGTISATYDVNVVEASSGGTGGETGGETQPYEAELFLQPVMAGTDWNLHPASTSSDCTGFECRPIFKYFDFPKDMSSTDTSYMYCNESIPVVTDSEKKSNNIPCITGFLDFGSSGPKIEFITLKLSNSDASTLDELKTYLTNNVISLKVNMRPEVSKYTFNMDNITMTSPNQRKDGYVIGEFIDDNCPVTTQVGNTSLLLAGLPPMKDWSLNIGYSYFKIVEFGNHKYISFQIAENLLETPDLDGIKKFISKKPTLYYVV